MIIYMASELGIDVMGFDNYGSSIIYGHPQAPTAARLIMELIEEVVLLGGGTDSLRGVQPAIQEHRSCEGLLLIPCCGANSLRPCNVRPFAAGQEMRRRGYEKEIGYSDCKSCSCRGCCFFFCPGLGQG